MDYSSKERDLISIVMPAMNEEKNLPLCHEKVSGVMAPLDCDYEVLVIDNDSTDQTRRVCEEICAGDPHWSYIKLSRNFTAEHSIAAGLRYARGDAVIILLSDLQEPPELIPEFIARWREGYAIVYGIHTARPGESLGRRLFASLYYRLINLLSDIPLPEHVADFRLMDRKVVNAVNRLGERNRYLRGLSQWLGFNRCGVKYSRSARESGQSKTSVIFLLAYALRAISIFSNKPLRFFLFGGFFIMSITVVLAAFYFFLYLFIGSRAPGILTVVLLLLANLGLTALGIGVLGEYISNIYTETKQRPLWIVEDTINRDIPEEHRYGD
ncbi:MAG: glycosyltransferase family 2 protein [Candidatus Glassbacteria bacterium]|nr:glycosyltransferase family 2 protein [Candidatus Glassbacteria bacterium]